MSNGDTGKPHDPAGTAYVCYLAKPLEAISPGQPTSWARFECDELPSGSKELREAARAEDTTGLNLDQQTIIANILERANREQKRSESSARWTVASVVTRSTRPSMRVILRCLPGVAGVNGEPQRKPVFGREPSTLLAAPKPVRPMFAGDMAPIPGPVARKAKEASKETARPDTPSYEGYTVTALAKPPKGETVSWDETTQATMPLSSQQLYESAVAHAKRYNTTLERQVKALRHEQRAIVDRVVSVRNSEEQEPDAEWVLFSVVRRFVDVRGELRNLQVNNALQVILRRQARSEPAVPQASGSGLPGRGRTS